MVFCLWMVLGASIIIEETIVKLACSACSKSPCRNPLCNQFGQGEVMEKLIDIVDMGVSNGAPSLLQSSDLHDQLPGFCSQRRVVGCFLIKTQ